MSFITRFGTNLFTSVQRFSSTTTILSNQFHSITNTSTISNSNALIPGGPFTLAVRNKIRCYFPKPSERKRIKRHGFWARMSTLAGRRILMRRILKGRHVLSH